MAVSNFALERCIRYVKLGLLVGIGVCLLKICLLLSAIADNEGEQRPPKFSPLYDVDAKGYNKKLAMNSVLYRLKIQPSYFEREWHQNGKFRFSTVTCTWRVDIEGERTNHTMCQVPFYPQLGRNTKNVFFIGGTGDERFRRHFEMLTGTYFNLTEVNGTETEHLMKEHLGLKDLVSAGELHGKTEMIKYDIENVRQEHTVYSLTTPVEACTLFVALRAHPIGRVRQFIWEMNSALYHVLRLQIRSRKPKKASSYARRAKKERAVRGPRRQTFVTFIRHSCLTKYNADGPHMSELTKKGTIENTPF